MTALPPRFDESSAYEKFMGPWSRAVGIEFLRWLSPPTDVRWLDMGCGSGISTELIVERCAPASVIGIDPSQAQIDHACRRHFANHVQFQIADAKALPFSEASFDVAISGLVLNFIDNPLMAISEFRRVLRPNGLVGCYVWDFAAERSPSWPMRVSMRRVGIEVPNIPGAENSSLSALRSIFNLAGLKAVATETIDVTISYRHFDQFWQSQTTSYSPTTTIIQSLEERDRSVLVDALRSEISLNPDGRVEYCAHANAVKATIAPPPFSVAL
jgi:SAM-dependent methyltransferase